MNNISEEEWDAHKETWAKIQSQIGMLDSMVREHRKMEPIDKEDARQRKPHLLQETILFLLTCEILEENAVELMQQKIKEACKALADELAGAKANRN